MYLFVIFCLYLLLNVDYKVVKSVFADINLLWSKISCLLQSFPLKTSLHGSVIFSEIEEPKCQNYFAIGKFDDKGNLFFIKVTTTLYIYIHMLLSQK